MSPSRRFGAREQPQYSEYQQYQSPKQLGVYSNKSSPCCSGSTHNHPRYTPYGYATAQHDCRRRRTMYTASQVDILEEEYENDYYVDTLKRATLARRLSLSEAQIKIWFQNRRAKDKRDGRFIETKTQKTNVNGPIRQVPSRNMTPSESSTTHDDQTSVQSEAAAIEFPPQMSQLQIFDVNGIPNNLPEYMASSPGSSPRVFPVGQGYNNPQLTGYYATTASFANGFSLGGDAGSLRYISPSWAEQELTKQPDGKVFAAL